VGVALLLSCGTGQYVALNVQVVIPAEVRTIKDVKGRWR